MAVEHVGPAAMFIFCACEAFPQASIRRSQSDDGPVCCMLHAYRVLVSMVLQTPSTQVQDLLQDLYGFIGVIRIIHSRRQPMSHDVHVPQP